MAKTPPWKFALYPPRTSSKHLFWSGSDLNRPNEVYADNPNKCPEEMQRPQAWEPWAIYISSIRQNVVVHRQIEYRYLVHICGC